MFRRSVVIVLKSTRLHPKQADITIVDNSQDIHVELEHFGENIYETDCSVESVKVVGNTQKKHQGCRQ